MSTPHDGRARRFESRARAHAPPAPPSKRTVERRSCARSDRSRAAHARRPEAALVVTLRWSRTRATTRSRARR